jgi:hypothetical protein
MAEREGFEPPKDFRPCRFSRPVPSTTRPPLPTDIIAGLASPPLFRRSYSPAQNGPVRYEEPIACRTSVSVCQKREATRALAASQVSQLTPCADSALHSFGYANTNLHRSRRCGQVASSQRITPTPFDHNSEKGTRKKLRLLRPNFFGGEVAML